TLLRVKLHAADVPSRDDRRVARPVLGLAEHDASVVRFAEVRMHEVEERLVFNAFGKFVRPPPLDLIPADLRHVQPDGEAAHAPAQEAKPARHAELLRLLKQQLHPDAHAQQRRPFLNALAHETLEAAPGQSLHARAERADARKHELQRLAQHALVRTDDRIAARRPESLLDRPKVAHAVINYRNTGQRPTSRLPHTSLTARLSSSFASTLLAHRAGLRNPTPDSMPLIL